MRVLAGLLREPRRWLAALAILVAGCAGKRPSEFPTHGEQAEKHYSAGRYGEAAAAWLRAAGAARERRSRVEAEFRAAASFERARDFERAKKLYEKLAEEPEPSERSERAAFALAYIEIEQGPAAAGHASLERALREHPNSGLAATALGRRLSFVREQGGSEAVLSYLDELAAAVGASELAESVAYARARELERLGATLDARDAYLESAERFPYPGGAYWDDALFHAAECDLKLGRPEAAIGHLERMLAEREEAHLQGSYERPRYAEARFLIARTYRDRLAQPARARAEFRRVFREHPTSLLADDALWQEAVTSARAGDTRGTCEPLEILTKELAHSRFAACARELCPSLPPLGGRRCHAYLLRDLNAPDAERP